jgi:ComF family protein
MVRTWQAFLKLVWPHEVIPKANTTHQVVRFFNGTQYLSLYRDPTIQTLIKQTKYQANQTAAIQLASYLNWYVDSVKTDYVIIPMPISYQRWRARGYNHIELICKQSQHASKTHTGILRKSRHTTQQTQVKRSERISQQRGTFSCHPAKCRTLPRTVILLDDVVTTGATMAAARAVMEPHLPPHTKLICLALAH